MKQSLQAMIFIRHAKSYLFECPSDKGTYSLEFAIVQWHYPFDVTQIPTFVQQYSTKILTNESCYILLLNHRYDKPCKRQDVTLDTCRLQG